MREYMTATEAAKALGLSLQTVLRRIEAGAVRAERAGRRMWLIPTAEIERLRTRKRNGHDDHSEQPKESPTIERRLTPETLARLLELNERVMRGPRLSPSSLDLLREARGNRHSSPNTAP